MTLIAGKNLDNVGTLKATNNLSATAGEEIVNGGLIQAGNRLDLLAGNTIVNRAGGIIAGRDVSAIALTADVINERTLTTRDSTASGIMVIQVVSTVTTGGSLAASAGQDLTLTSSRLSAANEAYLVAGGKLDLLAAQESDYSLYDKKKKGRFGSKKTQRDEVTQITHIGSEIKTGGDQTYQAAKLDSGNDLDRLCPPPVEWIVATVCIDQISGNQP